MRAATGTEIRQAVRGRWLSRNEPIPIRGVSIDSRTAGRDDLFIAIDGDRFDGHDYLVQAADAGCVAAIVRLDRNVPPDVMGRFPAGVIGVPDTREALLELGAWYRGVIPATIVGITGSNGKTTVKNMIDHVLRTRLSGTSSPASYNNDIGVPLTLLSAAAGDDYVICEAGTNAPGEISRLARVIKPNIAVVTSIGAAHLERLESVEKIAVEKAALLGWLGDRDLAVCSADSDALAHALKSYERRTILFGESPRAQLRLTGYECDGATQRFQINDREWYELSVPGRHNALNAIAAMAVCARFGFSQDDAAAALKDFAGVPMRLERIEAGRIRILCDAYNANPSSVLAAVDVLSDIRSRRRVLVVGDMLELGATSAEIHHEIGRSVAVRRVDLVVGVGPMGTHLAEAAAGLGMRTASFASTDAAIEGIGEVLADGDAVLLKGSRGMGLERLVDPIRACGGVSAPEPASPEGAPADRKRQALRSKLRRRRGDEA